MIFTYIISKSEFERSLGKKIIYKCDGTIKTTYVTGLNTRNNHE